MEPLEWLQWVLIPRMHQLLESGMPLPRTSPWPPIMKWLWIMLTLRAMLLAELVQLDGVFAGGEA
jgi:uncharacterized protein YqcC (DUF446 family)